MAVLHDNDTYLCYKATYGDDFGPLAIVARVENWYTSPIGLNGSCDQKGGVAVRPFAVVFSLPGQASVTGFGGTMPGLRQTVSTDPRPLSSLKGFCVGYGLHAAA